MGKRLADAFALAKLIEQQGSKHKATLADALMDFWDGRVIPYNEIETRHLRNIINYLECRNGEDFRLPELRRELQRRR